MFIAFLYMFRATMCPSSGENTVPMRHLVLVTLYRLLVCRVECPAHKTVGSVYKIKKFPQRNLVKRNKIEVNYM